MTVTIAEELLLLALSEHQGRFLISTAQLDLALGGGVLAELALAGRIAKVGRRLAVAAPQPLGDAELDAALSLIARDRPRTPEWWVRKLKSDDLRGRLLARLARAGVLAMERTKALGIFPVTRWPELNPAVEAEVRSRAAAVLAGAAPDARTTALIALAKAAGLDRKAFPGSSRSRVKELARGHWVADAVARAIGSDNVAVMTTTIT
ncbi:GPP34 family phosphoprotein [Nonomuraea sp. NPDC049309]|uniref:GOLPH3/VPS74 family protein n=1 Tax=Nonomuraea sp. NPDC049309 TaxID=3364350 RepID=UPI0037246C3D